MPIADHVFTEMDRRRREQAAELTGANEPRQAQPDTYAEKLRRAQEAQEAAYARSLANFGEPGVYAPPTPPAPRPAWDVQLSQVIAGLELTTPLSLELRRLIAGAGAENIVKGLQALGAIKRIERE